MARTKIDYGIDLGTTNSSIARNDDGNIVIIKSQANQMDTTPSCVYSDKKKTRRVGLDALNEYRSYFKDCFDKYSRGDKTIKPQNVHIEFKRTMGTDYKYEFPNLEKELSSEELSAEVLKNLKGNIRDDNPPLAAVITVPAMFRQPQIDATQRAAELAGFQYCELLQEPIAASMAYGLSAKTLNGYWLVFDFGGGTFDVSLMKVVDGIIKVIDNSGDNHLGGKNIDQAIIDGILIPRLKERFQIDRILSDGKAKALLQGALKGPAEQLKIKMASQEEVNCYVDGLGENDEGEEWEIDKDVTLEEFEKVVKPVIKPAIEICHKLLKKNNLTAQELEKIILIGGPTFLQTLRNMLKEELSENIDYSIDPMTAVAQGAALFASTKDIPDNLQVRDRTKIQLKLRYPETTVETEDNLGIKVQRDDSEGEIPEKLYVEVVRKDKGWTSGRVTLEGDAEVVQILLDKGKANGFTVTLFDEQGNILPCEPSSFTVIQGLKTTNVPLSYHYCIEAVVTEKGKQCLVPIKGIEKNTSLPAKGERSFKTQHDIRPGNKEDVLEIPLYESQDKESRAFIEEHACTFKITGEQLPQFLPTDSEVEVTIEIDASRRVKISAYFPYIDETVESAYMGIQTEDVNADLLERDINKARQTISMHKADIQAGESAEVDKLLVQLEEVQNIYNNRRDDRDTRDELAHKMKNIWKNIDGLVQKNEWPKVEQELSEALAQIETNQERYGNEKTAAAVSQYKQQAKRIIEVQDVSQARELADQIHSLNFQMVSEDIGLWVALLKGFDDDFEVHDWKDRGKARELIDAGKQILATQPSKDKLQEVVIGLYSLLPERDQPIVEGFDKNLLRT